MRQRRTSWGGGFKVKSLKILFYYYFRAQVKLCTLERNKVTHRFDAGSWSLCEEAHEGWVTVIQQLQGWGEL
jgi:hypothetical protein